MRARMVLWIGLCLGLSGCLLPTPASIVTSGLDVVSFVASGKTVADQGVSLVMGEDCAMVRLLSGEICRAERDYQVADAEALLTPLSAAPDDVLLAEAHPEIRAAAERLAAHDGWTTDDPTAGPQYAMLGGGFVADDVSPQGYSPAGPSEAPAPVLAAAPRAVPREALQAEPEPQLAAAAAPEALTEPAAGPELIPRRRPAQEPVLLASAVIVSGAWSEPIDLAEEQRDPALERAPAAASEPAGGGLFDGLAALEWRAPVFATASDEFGERPTVVRYGAITEVAGVTDRHIARSRWVSTEAQS